MGRFQLMTAALMMTLATATAQAGPPVRIGIGIGVGAPYYYRPYYGYGYGYGYPYYYPGVIVRPAPVIVEGAPPVVYQPAPVVVQQQQPLTQQPGVVVSNAQPTNPQPTVPSITNVEPAPISPVVANGQGNLEFHLQRLTNPDENIRRDSVMELGRARSDRAVDPLAATLAGDRSAVVRDAAARALGLIGSPRSLTVLIHAAQADNDRDVRRSAQFAVEVIRGSLPR